MTITVIGHMNPDTDSTISAISLAYLLNKRGMEAVPFMQGEPMPETKFVLETMKLKQPEITNSLKDKDVFIVDTTETAQMPADLNEANILGMVDHHKMGDITTSAPVEMWVWPVGCTGTVITNMFKFYEIDIPADIAGGLLSAIISDTVLFKSPTTTPADKLAVEKLAKIAGIDDVNDYGMQILRKKSDVENESPADLMNRDFKDFNYNAQKYGIGQVEVIDIAMLDSKRDGLLEEMKNLKQSSGYHTVLLMLTDIMKEGTELLMVSDDISPVEKAFGKTFDNGYSIWLDGVLSRKKQIVPQLEDVYK